MDDPRTMDIVNPELRGMPQEEYRQEVNRRTFKAGHTTREGGPIPLKSMSKPGGKKYRENYKRAFGHD